jgi:hypothetical protein
VSPDLRKLFAAVTPPTTAPAERATTDVAVLAIAFVVLAASVPPSTTPTGPEKNVGDVILVGKYELGLFNKL